MGSRFRQPATTTTTSNGFKPAAKQTVSNNNNNNNVNLANKLLHKERKILSNRQQVKDNQRIGLLVNSSDGLEGFSSSSQSSANSNNNVNGYFHHHQHHQKQQQKDPEKANSDLNHHKIHHLQYINNDGAIFTVASNIQNPSSSSARSSLNKQQSYIFQPAQQTEGVLNNFDSPSNSLAHDSIIVEESLQNNYHNQHRLLRQEVHQQLAKIYGGGGNFSKNSHQSSPDRNQFLLQRHKQQVKQRSLAATAAAVANNKRQLTTSSSAEQAELAINSANLNPTTTNIKSTKAMFKNHHHHHHHLISSSSSSTAPITSNQIQQDQTYDSLTPDSSFRNQFSDTFYITTTLQDNLLTNGNGSSSNGSSSNQNITTGQQPICAIPEEQCDNLIDTNINNDHDHGDLLLPDPCLIDDNKQIGNNKRASVDRKSQLENLHYATVTAAALLNATANAAAAIAATEKHFNSSLLSSSNNNNIITRANQQPIYSDTYQEIRKQRYSQHEHNQYLQNAAKSANKTKLAHQQRRRDLIDINNNNNASSNLPIYADAYGENNNNQSNMKDRRPPLPQVHICNGASSTSAIYGPLLRNNGNHSFANQIYNLKQPPQMKPPQPPIRVRNSQQHQRLSNNINNGSSNQHAVEAFIRQQQQQNQQRLLSQQRALIHHQQLLQQQQQHQQSLFSLAQQPQLQQAPPQIPAALAIVHHGSGKNTSMKADLIGRMLINNMQHHHHHQQQQRQRNTAEAQHYAIGLNRNHAIPVLTTNNDNGKVLNNNELLLSRQFDLGLGVYQNNSNKQECKGNKQIYSVPPPIFTLPAIAAGLASSNSSGSSNVPLVIRKPTGIIERICTIDLTIFWWSLTFVSFIFISIVIVISRYIF